MILRDPLPTDGGKVGTVSAPTQLPEVKAPAIVPGKVPDHIKDITFDDKGLDDFEVEQLPEQGKDTTPTKKEEGTKKEEKVVEQKKEEVKQSEEKKVEEKEEKKEEQNPLLRILKAPGAKKEEQKVEGGKEGIKPIVPGARDYSSFSTQEAAALKQMSNEGFELASRLIKENKELGKLKETTYLQHERAYLLDPQFNELQTNAYYAQKEAAYWKQQLVNMDAGKDVIPITGWDAKGNPILGTPVKATKDVEEDVRTLLNNAYQTTNQIQGQLQQYPAKYKSTVQKDLQNIEAYRKQQFGWVTNPEYLDYSVNIEGLGECTLKQVREDVRGMLPVYMQNHPLAEVLGDLVIGIRLKDAELAELRNGKAVEQVKQKEQELVEPSSKEKGSHKTNGEAVHGITEFRIDDSLV
jgi:hypothetical protein